MKLATRFLGIFTGFFLVAFGVSLEAVQEGGEGAHTYTFKKTLGPKRSSNLNSYELREKLRVHMGLEDRRLYNRCREIARDQEKKVEERIQSLVTLSNQDGLSRSKRFMVLNNAVLLAHKELEGDDREKTLGNLGEQTSQAKWLLQENPNSNLLRLSQVQYEILVGDEDL